MDSEYLQSLQTLPLRTGEMVAQPRHFGQIRFLSAGGFTALAIAITAVVAAMPVLALAETGAAPVLVRPELVPQVGHRDFVTSVAYSPDGDHVVSGDGTGSVRIWDARTGEETALLTGHAGTVNAVAYRPDSERMASGGEDGTVRIWQAKTGAETAVLFGNDAGVNSVVYSPDGSRIVSGSDDGAVRIWNPRTREARVLAGHGQRVNVVAYSPDGAFIASGGNDGVRIWDAHSGREAGKQLHGLHGVRSIAYSPDGSRIVTVSGKAVRIWNAHTGVEESGLADAIWVTSVVYSPDGRRIAAGSRNEVVRIWDADTGEETAVLTGHRGGANAIAYSPDGTSIVVGSHDGAVRISDVDTGVQMAVLGSDEEWLSSIAYSPDGRRIAVASSDRTVRVVAADTGAEQVVLKADDVHPDRPHFPSQVTYSPDGRSIVSGSNDGMVRTWNAHTGELRAIWKGFQGGSHSVAFSPDGSRVALGSAEDGTLRVWDAATGKELLVMSDPERQVGAVAYSPDGRRIASVSRFNTIRIWDAYAGSETAVLRFDDKPATYRSLTYSPDGKFVASGTDSGTVRIWDAYTGEPEAELPGHPGDRHHRAVYSVAYSPDGGKIISGSYDGTVRIWDANTGRLQITIAGAGLVNSVAYSPDGTRIASSAYEGWLRTWHIGRLDSEMVTPEMVHQRLPGSRWIAFRPGSVYYVANSGAEHQVRIRFDGHRCPIFRFLFGDSSCPVYPLEWYRDVLRLDPQATEQYAALQRQDPDIRPQELRMVWVGITRIGWLPVVLSVLVLVMLGITIQLMRRRRDPLALMKEFFSVANDYEVRRRLTSHALLLGDRSATHHYAVLNINGTKDVASVLARCTKRTRRSKGVPLLFLVQPRLDSDRLHERTKEAYRIKASHRVDVVPMALTTLERALRHGTVDAEVNAAKDLYVTRQDPYFESVPVRDPTLFFGRSAQLQTISRLLSQGQHVGVFGLRKTGKTSLAHQLRLRFREVPVVSISCQELDRHSAAQLLSRIAEELRSDLRDRFDIRSDSGADGDSRTQLRPLIGTWQALRSEPFVIILDEIDTLLPFANANGKHDLLVEGRIVLGVLRSLAQELKGVVLVVIAKRPDVNRINLFPADAGENPMFMGFREVYAGALSSDECDSMIRELGTWRGIDWEPEALRLLYRYCGGHPFVARLFASDACEQGRRTWITADHVERTADNIRTAMRSHLIGSVYKQVYEDLRVEELEILRRITVGSWPLSEPQLQPIQEQALTDLENFGLVNGRSSVEISPKLFEYWITTEQFS